MKGPMRGMVGLLLLAWSTGACGGREESVDQGTDLRTFSEFTYSRSRAACSHTAGLYQVHSASISWDGERSLLDQSVLITASAGGQTCLEELSDGFCVARYDFGQRPLSEEEEARVESVFNEVALYRAPPDADTCVLHEPCFIADFNWDGESYSDDICEGPPRLEQESKENIEELLEELRDGSCHEVFTQRNELAFEALITDYEGAPFSGVTVRCSEETEILAISDDQGKIAFVIEARGNLPCGLVDCTSLAFAHPTEMSEEQELDLREVHMREIALRRE